MSSVIRMRAITAPRTCDCGCGVTIHPSVKPWEGDCDGERLVFVSVEHFAAYDEAMRADDEEHDPRTRHEIDRDDEHGHPGRA